MSGSLFLGGCDLLWFLFVVCVTPLVILVLAYLARISDLEDACAVLRGDVEEWRARTLTRRPERAALKPEELERRSDVIADELDKHDLG